VLDIGNEEPKAKNFAEEIRSYELSLDGKKLVLRKKDDFYVEEASASAPAKLEKSIDLKNWTFALKPRDEWRQMFVEAWRLERDYFYDRKMHSLDWPAVLKKYLPIVERVTDRAELSDLIGDMVSELSALHINVVGGDHREGPDQIKMAYLGAVLAREESRGGWRVEHIYKTDPDYPNKLSPLARPGVNVKAGDVIEMINGVATLSVAHPQALLRNQAGKQVLLRVRSSSDDKARDVIVKPLDAEDDADLRYSEWEYTRRQRVEELGRGELGYVHLRAMSRDDIAQWAREYYPVYNRKGLIVDVRHNGGGNIDSWILEKLMRKAWFYWQPRVGAPTWNMQYAFRGHMVVLCDEFTGSDGEAFSEGFKRLGLGKVIGKRTWGGEIWLSASNFLVDRGIATAAEIGVYGPEGQWLIEGHGVEPDIVVDNLPHATFKGEDAQLQKAIQHLQERIREEPVTIPAVPAYPDKSVR
jgi:tricorn protease